MTALKAPPRSPVPAEARGKARRWMLSLPHADDFERACNSAVNLVDAGAITHKKGRGWERAAARARQALAAWGEPAAARPGHMVWQRFALVDKVARAMVDNVFDPALLDQRAVCLFHLSIDERGMRMHQSFVSASEHMVGRWFERLRRSDLEGDLISAMNEVLRLPADTLREKAEREEVVYVPVDEAVFVGDLKLLGLAPNAIAIPHVFCRTVLAREAISEAVEVEIQKLLEIQEV
ncbi:hypothetical protein [Falsiroseomonas sp. HW251]|uniref:hypothetical protein n=1 Tax=Falsiroseomonas sp. HW251 TaxID=3390998 RepID=UPI003D31F657